ncbi:MAG: PRC-barrel domain-containing protein [Hyphomicrobiales bacterium]|nr:PRC-barrel domain-containing protein [Hyphomicrobiales bacterium]
MRKFMLAAIAASALAGAATAQNTAPNATNGANTAMDNGANAANSNASTPGANPNGANPPANAPQAHADVPKTGPHFVNVQHDDMLSTNIVGLDIYNDQNNNIGQIHDVVVDPSKKIAAYILSVGGFLGMGTRYVAVDPGSVNIEYDRNNKAWRAAMNATKDQLKAAPEFKYSGQWTASRS